MIIENLGKEIKQEIEKITTNIYIVTFKYEYMYMLDSIL